MDEVEYDSMFIFKYSKRPNTPALQYEDHIPEEEKTRRFQILQERQRTIQMRRNAEYVGRREEVHVEGFNTATGQWIGRTSQNKTLNFLDPSLPAPSAGQTLVGSISMSWSRERRPNSLAGERADRSGSDCSRLVDMADGENMEVEMKIRGLMMDPMTNMPIVVLKDLAGDSVLPIWVGIYEANAIALEIEKVTTPRPMTHDLIKVLLMGLDTSVKKVVVSELKDDTFYALIWLERDGELISVDSRPSDALALALRHDCPIYVEERVLQSSKNSTTVSEKVNNEELRKWLENLNDEDLGRYKM